jgi:hypothetical protein
MHVKRHGDIYGLAASLGDKYLDTFAFGDKYRRAYFYNLPDANMDAFGHAVLYRNPDKYWNSNSAIYSDKNTDIYRDGGAIRDCDLDVHPPDNGHGYTGENV